MQESDLREFAARMSDHGLNQWPLIADGRIHRFGTRDRHGDDAGWYVLHDAYPRSHGAFGDWRTGLVVPVVLGEQPATSWAESQERIAKDAQLRRQIAAEKERRELLAIREATRLWRNADGVPLEHPYLDRKHIDQPHTVRVSDDLEFVLVPLHDDEFVIRQMQKIAANGEKRPVPGAPTKGLFHLIKTRRPLNEVYEDNVAVCEGFATGWSYWSLHGGRQNVFCAMSAKNKGETARAALRIFPGAAITAAADNDRAGLDAADVVRGVAQEAGVEFTLRVPDGAGQDWSDVWVNRDKLLEVAS
jgi:putative DNA primase/helicase